MRFLPILLLPFLLLSCGKNENDLVTATITYHDGTVETDQFSIWLSKEEISKKLSAYSKKAVSKMEQNKTALIKLDYKSISAITKNITDTASVISGPYYYMKKASGEHGIYQGTSDPQIMLTASRPWSKADISQSLQRELLQQIAQIKPFAEANKRN